MKLSGLKCGVFMQFLKIFQACLVFAFFAWPKIYLTKKPIFWTYPSALVIWMIFLTIKANTRYCCFILRSDERVVAYLHKIYKRGRCYVMQGMLFDSWKAMAFAWGFYESHFFPALDWRFFNYKKKGFGIFYSDVHGLIRIYKPKH